MCEGASGQHQPDSIGMPLVLTSRLNTADSGIADSASDAAPPRSSSRPVRKQSIPPRPRPRSPALRPFWAWRPPSPLPWPGSPPRASNTWTSNRINCGSMPAAGASTAKGTAVRSAAASSPRRPGCRMRTAQWGSGKRKQNRKPGGKEILNHKLEIRNKEENQKKRNPKPLRDAGSKIGPSRREARTGITKAERTKGRKESSRQRVDHCPNHVFFRVFVLSQLRDYLDLFLKYHRFRHLSFVL